MGASGSGRLGKQVPKPRRDDGKTHAGDGKAQPLEECESPPMQEGSSPSILRTYELWLTHEAWKPGSHSGVQSVKARENIESPLRYQPLRSKPRRNEDFVERGRRARMMGSNELLLVWTEWRVASRRERQGRV